MPSSFPGPATRAWSDRKSTRLNSSHSQISYAVFCLKKKKIHVIIIDQLIGDRLISVLIFYSYRTTESYCARIIYISTTTACLPDSHSTTVATVSLQ